MIMQGHFRHVVAYLKDFLFKPSQAHCPVAALSGGEKNRLMLAKILAQPSNFLVLDEPTNDLDMDTLDLLQEVLDEYGGTILVVSHDRDFLDRVVSSVIYLKGDGSVYEHAGSYSELLEKNATNITKATTKQNSIKKEDVKPKEKAKKLSYNQQRLLDVLPVEVEQLEQQICAVSEELSDTNLYTDSPDRFDELSKLLPQLQELKEQKENQWLELQMLAETL